MRTALAGARRSRFASTPGQRSAATTLPAPVEGLDSETPVAELPQTRAIQLDNFIPRGTGLEMRKGSVEHVTGLPAAIESLLVYNSGATSTMFAASGTGIYDVTSAGAVGSAVQSGLSNARWQGVNFQTAGGTFLWICNGVDNPRHWNGSAWATPSLTITTYTDNDISYVCESKQRLFFVFKNTLTFGYLPVDSVAGTVSNYGLGSVFGRGGRLVAIGTFTQDGGAGPDDYTAFLTSEGELAIFSGVNPGSSTEWSLVGRWHVGEPIGDRPLVQMDGDLGIITRNGLAPASYVMSGGSDTPRYYSGRISTIWRDLFAASQNAVSTVSNGWHALDYAAGDMLIVNMPTTQTTAVQLVQHAQTGGWTRFTGWNAGAFAIMGGALYYGDLTSKIWRADVGYNDSGTDIEGVIQTPWTSLGTRGGVKHMRMARIVCTTETQASLALVARGDYRSVPSLPAVAAGAVSNALIWGTGTWGDYLWGGEDLATRSWRSLSGQGTVMSFLMRARTNLTPFEINGLDLIYEQGGPV